MRRGRRGGARGWDGSDILGRSRSPRPDCLCSAQPEHGYSANVNIGTIYACRVSLMLKPLGPLVLNIHTCGLEISGTIYYINSNIPESLQCVIQLHQKPNRGAGAQEGTMQKQECARGKVEAIGITNKYAYEI